MIWAEKIGLGELELLPWEFWRLTPREFQMRYEGLLRREDRAWQKVGRLGVAILSPHLKPAQQRNLTIEKFVGRILRLWPRTE